VRFSCCDPRRLGVIAHSGHVNAIDFLEVLDRSAPPGVPHQRTLFVRLLRPGFTLTPDNLRITGGERIRTVGVVWCAPADQLPAEAEPGLVDGVDDLPRTLVIRSDSAGDFSTYTLSIVAGLDDENAPADFDPKLNRVTFSFKVECPADFDCAAPLACPPTAAPRPQIDYLAKDYQSFRRLMLDRMSLLAPGWTERSEADLGVTLVELLAYAADNLSYRQDAIANEAYLATARQRVSVRRHARLVDYFLHEGCNARAFVAFEVSGSAFSLPAGTELLTRTPGLEVAVHPDDPKVRDAIDGGALVFETARDAELDERLNTLHFYTWGNAGCCLPRGSTSATLATHLEPLRPGDVVVFEEVVSPTTFGPEDADPRHRWAVRLTEVVFTSDPSGRLFDEHPVDAPLEVTEIRWDAADALPFPLCLSVSERPGLELSVARGNVVLVDHGQRVLDEALGQVPRPTLAVAARAPGDPCARPQKRLIPARFRPSLLRGPLSHGFDLAALLAIPISDDQRWWPASSLVSIDPRSAMPLIRSLTGRLHTVDEAWTPRRDLLASGADTPDVVVEIEDDGLARLRFGDDANGKRPDPETSFSVSYRVGNGAVGNVGAEAIAHVLTGSDGIVRVRNPLPAGGGVEPEDIEAARRDAPEAFRSQERAVTPADYAAAAERRADVQRATAEFRWTGSWYTAFVTADRFGGAELDARFAAALRASLERFRMAGCDLAIRAPRYVPLDVALHLCVRPDYFRAQVLQAAKRVLSADVLPDGSLGVFHPDNFSFGDAVYLSRIVAAAQAVEGVEAVRVDRFQRFSNPSPTSLDAGVIAIGDVEIAELANNPNSIERGRIELQAGGGK
jgi:hypothetical protein